jgi:methyl-accepting chemotaxis protein
MEDKPNAASVAADVDAKPTPQVNFSELHQTNLRSQDTTQLEQRFLGTLALLLLGATLSGLFIFVGIAVLLNQPSLWLLVAACGILSGSYIPAYWCSRNPNLIRVGSWLLLVAFNLLVMFIAYLLGPAQPIASVFLIIVMLSLFLLPKLATFVLGLLGLVCTIGTTLVDYQPPIFFSDIRIAQLLSLVIWCLVILTASLLGMVLAQQLSELKQLRQLANKQAQYLHDSLMSIEHKREFGQTVSQRIAAVTAELQAVSRQQTNGSEQQVVALTEVISFLSELAATARIIEAKTETINSVSAEVLGLSENVQQTTLAVAQTGERGLVAVERTIENSQVVSRLYTSLKGLLEALRQRSNKISSVIGQLRELSDETHLLALNASIEAAGAGVYGERFEVVAREVKNLADRSRQASNSAEESLLEVEVYIKQAVEMSGAVQEQTQQAVSVATEAGEVINALVLVIGQNTTEAARIWQAATTMRLQMQEIKAVASQQRSGTGQAVETLRELGAVAEQNASGSMQVNSTSHDLEELSQELALVLAA